MVFKLLAINVDGTLLESDGTLTRTTKEAISYVVNKEVYVTLVTNWNFPSAMKLAKTLKIPSSKLVTHSGAFISDNVEDPFIDRRLTSMKTFQVVQALEYYDCNVRVVHEHFSYANRRKLDVNLIASAIFSKGDPVFYPIQFYDSLADVLRDEEVLAPKIDVFFDDVNEREEAIHVLLKNFRDIDIIPVNDVKFEVVPKGVSKLWGLQQVGKQLGINLSEMVYIGDGIDDLDTISSVGLGVAMGNAPLEVKRAADWVTRSNNENGVAYMVRELFRKQHRLAFISKISKQS